jgi:hypothetical protein
MRAWRYDELVREGMSLINAHAPNWTDHNASDPGITLIELLAYFTELLAYRVGRVTPQARLQFLRLLHGTPHASVPLDQVDAAIAQTLNAMSQAECAVTAADFERLAIDAANAMGCAVDARCLPAIDLGRRGGDERSHVSVVLLPQVDLAADALARLCGTVEHALAPRCLLGTRVQVAGPTWLHLGLGFRLVVRHGAMRQAVLDAIEARLHTSASDAVLRIADITEAIDNVAGVDHVENVSISSLSPEPNRLFDAPASVGIQIALHSTPGIDALLGLPLALDPLRLQRDDAGRLSAVVLKPWEVARLHLVPGAVDVVELGARDAQH